MSTKELKSKIQVLMAFNENEDLLFRFYQSLLEDAKRNEGGDWWENLTDEQKSRVEASRASIATGKTYSNAEAFEESKKWLIQHS